MSLSKKQVLHTLGRIIDSVETGAGVTCPGWMLPDVIAVFCRDNHLRVRKCCVRLKNSCGLVELHYLIIQDAAVITCDTCGTSGSSPAGNSWSGARMKNVFTRHIRQALVTCTLLPDIGHV